MKQKIEKLEKYIIVYKKNIAEKKIKAMVYGTTDWITTECNFRGS